MSSAPKDLFNTTGEDMTTTQQQMIPATVHKLPALAVLSAMQKCIRRGMEREAMEFAVELMHTSKAFCSMVCNRLEIISHEDIDTLSHPHIVPYVATACAQARTWYDPKKLGKARMAIGNAIRLMCRADKSREGDHFQAAIGLASLLEDFTPALPDFAFDMHTSKGKRLGRGLEHFRKESTKLVPRVKKDAYEDEAYRLWEMKHSMIDEA
jgi:replication-associated recombination protein RarA